MAIRNKRTPTQNHRAKIAQAFTDQGTFTYTKNRSDDFRVQLFENKKGTTEVTIRDGETFLRLTPRKLATFARVFQKHYS